ncbi:MAG: hypothetical protein OXI12_01715 [Gammaproteobacteria bacterium]|nr:hypothetical protein [Gammaproteobacteria bacterium]
MTDTMISVIDPRDPDPQGTVEMTLDEFNDAGGDIDTLRDEAGSAGDTELVSMIDAWHASRA